MEWTGLDDWLSQQKGPVTKQQVADYVRDNQVQVNEVMKGGVKEEDILAHHDFSPEFWNDLGDRDRLDLTQQFYRDTGITPEGPTKFSQYTLPGGENYREMLLTLPTKGEVSNDVFGRPVVYQAPGEQVFKSSHYDEPNILAHVRFNDRMIDGKKTLFVEEVQSDWHQKGKREGYADPEVEAYRKDLNDEWSQLVDAGQQNGPRGQNVLSELRRVNQESPRSSVPDAPFKTTWPDLAMKRIIRYAAENGYDKVAWTPGDVQAARYDLSKHIDRIGYTAHRDGDYSFSAEKNGQSLLQEDHVDLKRIEEVLGKEMADKIKNQQGIRYDNYGGNQTFELSNLDLKVGGEGMRGFYDQMLPVAVNKLVKKHGVKVGKEQISYGGNEYGNKYGIQKGDDGRFHITTPDGRTGESFSTREEATSRMTGLMHPATTHQVHSLDITPSLRKSVMEQGFPQFASGGAVKVTKASVNYSGGMPARHCGICTFYSNKTCSKVQGTISPQMWCRLFKKKIGRAEGGGIFDQATRDYPVLKNYDIGYKENIGGGQGYMESYPPGEEGTREFPRPKEFPISGFGVENYRSDTRPIDVLGDVASHHLVNVDPTIKKTYQDFTQSLEPWQEDILRDQYQHATQNEGETRPYEQWRDVSGLPAYFRGYTFQQWPDEFNQRVYTPEQRRMLDGAMKYMQSGREGFADGGAPTLQHTAPFPDAPEGYEFYGPEDRPDDKFIPGVGAEGIPSYEAPEVKRKPTFFDRLATPSKYETEPDLQETQMGVAPPKGAVGMNDAGQYTDEKGDPIEEGPKTYRPGVLPLTFDPSGKPTLAMPKLADVISNIMGGNVPGGGAFLGSGLARAAKPSALDKVHTLSGVPRAEAEAVMEANAGKGLSPLEGAADEMRLKLERSQKLKPGQEPIGTPQERTVVKAPIAKEGEKQLPDFVVGKVTPEDWVARHEQILSKDEIAEAAKWYDKIFNEFLTQTKGDVPKAKQYMRGWLVAQQNVDVSGAMGNVLLQAEQLNRGMSPDKMRAAGMPNPTQAARAVMSGEPIKGGVGQKIYDFVDSAEDKSVRSWMANHPAGGEPFVVDVHTGRDTGLVDDKLINHLKRLGYDKDDLAKLKMDLKGSPTAAQYEGRADFGRELTAYLNKTKWQGRSDWKPKEVQAVGWMGMTKLTANQADDVVSGLSQNMRHLSMELSPGEGSPWHAKYGERFGSLASEDQYSLTHSMANDAIDHASKLAGIDVRDIVHGTGGWQNFQNPSTIAQSFATKEGAEIAANALGHMLQQTEVWSNKVKGLTANPKGFAVDFIASGNHNLNTDAGLRDFWSKIMEADPMKGTSKPLFEGYQPIVTRDGKSGIRVLIDRGGTGTQKNIDKALSGPINDVVKSLPYDMSASLREAEITKARNDWKAQKNGQTYLSRLRDLIGRDPTADLNSAGKELEEKFRQGIEAAEKRRKTPARKIGGAVRRLVPVAHNPFETSNAIRRAIHGH
jgi:hypothetical protein